MKPNVPFRDQPHIPHHLDEALKQHDPCEAEDASNGPLDRMEVLHTGDIAMA